MDSQGPVGLWSWGAAGTPGGGFSPPATSFRTLDVSCQRIPYLFFDSLVFEGGAGEKMERLKIPLFRILFFLDLNLSPCLAVGLNQSLPKPALWTIGEADFGASYAL